MSFSLKRLTVLAPRELEDAVLQVLLKIQPPAPGFTLMHASGHGQRFEGTSVREQVYGRVERTVLWVVLPAEDVERVLAPLRERIPNPDVVWWLEPVDTMGRLA